VALLIETASSYGRGLLRGISRYAALHGPWAFFLEPGGLEPVPRLGDWGIGGIIALLRNRRLARRILALGVPTVDLDFSLREFEPWGVVSDERAVGRLAAEHLLRCGLRHFAYCGWSSPGDPRGYWWESVRFRGFVEGLGAAGPAVRVHAAADRVWAREQKDLARWLRELPRPVGIFAGNDQRARHVLEAARLAGVAIPREAAVIGVDNDDVLCEMSTPSLSSVKLDAERMGYEGAALLDRLMSGRRAARKPVVVPPLGVAPRQSTDILASADAVTQEALRYIRANAGRPIRVRDVLQAVRVSRRTLETRFDRALGATPHGEIQRARLERARALLAETEWPIKKVAAASGFSYAERLHAVFRQALGLTPGRYRARHRDGEP
jgi:LacI family transcriptional regulator